MTPITKTAKPWQEPKRGERRADKAHQRDIYVKVPCVRHRAEATMKQVANQLWGIPVQTIMSLRGFRLVTMSKRRLALLPKWKKKQCPDVKYMKSKT